jgi:hypothetical protein
MPSIRVHGVIVDGILKLVVSRPPQADAALGVPGQTALSDFHVTLIRFDDHAVICPPDHSWPAPPPDLQLLLPLLFVNDGAKQSCYVQIDPPGQVLLHTYTQACAAAIGRPESYDTARVFHVSVSNAGGGLPRESVGPVWDFVAREI